MNLERYRHGELATADRHSIVPPHHGCRVEEHMAQQLQGKRVAALVTDGFEQVELTEPKKALEAAGASVEVIAPHTGKVRGWNHTEWGEDVAVDRALAEARPESYDALLLPGGVMNPDKLRTDARAVQFVKQCFDQGKPIAAICHGPWTLIEAGVVDGIQMTSYPSIQTDLKNAGARWVDQEVVVDRGIVTSRKPDDIPAFNRKMIEEFAEGRHGTAGHRQTATARG
jgi:protease I